MTITTPVVAFVALCGGLVIGACAAAATVPPPPAPAPAAPAATVASTSTARTAGPAASQPPPATPASAQPEAEIIAALHIGESITPPKSTTTVTFTDVSGDSRCPTNVACIWAGDAAVTLRVQPATGAAHVVELHTGVADRQSANVAGLRLRLDRLEPSPTFGKPTERTAYVATIAIASSAGAR